MLLTTPDKGNCILAIRFRIVNVSIHAPRRDDRDALLRIYNEWWFQSTLP